MRDRLLSLLQESRRGLFITICGIIFFFMCININFLMDFIKKILLLARPLFLAICMAYVINLPMRFIERKIKLRVKTGNFIYVRARGISMFLSFLFVIIVIVMLGLIVVPQLIESVIALINNIGIYITNIIKMIIDLLDSMHFDNAYVRDELNQFLNIPWDQVVNELVRWLSQAYNSIGSMASNIVSRTMSITGELGTWLAGFMISLYLLSGKETLLAQLRKMLVAFLGKGVSNKLFSIGHQANVIFSSFIGGQLVEAFILFILYYIGMSLFKMPYALLISTIIGMTSIIPVFGAMLGMGIGCLLILAIDPIKVIWFYLFYQTLQVIENNLIYPYVVGNSVGLPGVWVLLSILIFGGLYGVVGMFIAVPTSTLIYQLLGEFTNYCLRKRRLNVDAEGFVLEQKSKQECENIKD